MAAKEIALSIVLAIFAIFAGSSAFASIPRSVVFDETTSIELAPSIDRYEIPAREQDDCSLAVVDAATREHFESVSTIELSSISITDQLENRLSAITAIAGRPSLSVFTAKKKVASGLLALRDEANVNDASDLAAKRWWGEGFKAASFVEPATGLVYLRDRWYDPSIGTWLTPDAYGTIDSSNLYAYCAGNPVGCSDPTGMFGARETWAFTKSAGKTVVIGVGAAAAGTALVATGVVSAPVVIGGAVVLGVGAVGYQAYQRYSAGDATSVSGAVGLGIADVAGLTAGVEAYTGTEVGDYGRDLSSVERADRAGFAFGSVVTAALGPKVARSTYRALNFDDLGIAVSRGIVEGLEVDFSPSFAPRMRLGGGLSPHPMDQLVPGGSLNYRGRFQAALGAQGLPRLPADYDVHHSLPQQLRGDPRVGGFDIDSPVHGSGVPGYRRPGADTNIHSYLDQEWKGFFRQYPNANQAEILNFRGYLDWRFGHTYWENIQRQVLKER